MSYVISKKGLALIQKCEGFRAKPAALPGGGWVVGFGRVRTEGPGAAVTREEALAMLEADLTPFARLVNETVTHAIDQSQFDVLVSYAFSVGETGFRESALLRHLNAGLPIAAACALDVSGDEQGLAFEALVRRRTLEKMLFLKESRHVAAPSALLRDSVDTLASDIGRRLSRILRAEPATALLLTQTAKLGQEPEDEIVTAHARPAARAIDDKSGGSHWRNWLRVKTPIRWRAEHFSLIALFSFGAALTALGGSLLLAEGPSMWDSLGAATLSAPGLVALSLAGYGLWRGPEG
jgi:GH24 family phage-related lysozyme (muramidase)